MKVTFELSWPEEGAEIRAILAALNKTSAPAVGLPIGALALDTRTLNCLKAEGIETIDQLCRYSRGYLLKVPNLGRRSLDLIVRELGEMGRCLFGDVLAGDES